MAPNSEQLKGPKPATSEGVRFREHFEGQTCLKKKPNLMNETRDESEKIAVQGMRMVREREMKCDSSGTTEE